MVDGLVAVADDDVKGAKKAAAEGTGCEGGGGVDYCGGMAGYGDGGRVFGNIFAQKINSTFRLKILYSYFSRIEGH